jgi:hypothetical protein
VGFFPVNPFISLAEWTDVLLYVLHEFIDHTLLVITGVKADRTEFAHLCQDSVQ